MHKQTIDAKYLASTNVGSPDPRRCDPPKGEMVVAEWKIPKELLADDPKLVIHFIFNNFTQRSISFPITSSLGFKDYKITRDDFKKTKGILAYKGEILTKDREVFREWTHQLWVNLIEIEDDKEAAARISSLVAEKFKQPSVMDTPNSNESEDPASN